MSRFFVEFILSTPDARLQGLKGLLGQYSEGLEIAAQPQDDTERAKHFKIQLSTTDPTIIFDLSAQFGRLKSIRIDEHVR